MATNSTPLPLPHVPPTRESLLRRRPAPFDPADAEDFDHDNQAAQDFCRGIGGYRE